MKTLLLVLSLAAVCPARAWAEIRILSVVPQDPSPGDAVQVSGFGFDRATAVHIYRIVDRRPVIYRAEIRGWSDETIVVTVPRTVPPGDDYALQVLVPGRLISSNSVRLTIRQPPPPAEAVRNSSLVAENRCDTRGRSRVDGATERWSGGLYACDTPLRRITSHAAAVSIGQRFAITGDFGDRQPNEVLALMEVEEGRLHVRHLLRIHSWTPHEIAWDVTDNIGSWNYALGILYRLPSESGLVFERGSNIVHLFVRP